MKDEQKELEKKMADSYMRDTSAMILIFSQWCVNHDIDPEALYKEAYPEQSIPQELKNMQALTVPKEEAGEIPVETLLNVLMAFDNEQLAFAVQSRIGNK
jgi:hypothetical protein